MTRYLSLTKNGIIAFLISFLLMFATTVFVYAQDVTSGGSDKEVVKKYSINFPVEELGNCATIVECKAYCDNSDNAKACIDFARKKGFYNQQSQDQKKAEILVAAKVELGCDSEQSCKTFCGEQENWIRCGEFAKKHNLNGGQGKDPQKPEVLQIAKRILGCDSYEYCKNFCQQSQNQEKCSELAKMVGLKGGLGQPSLGLKGPQAMPVYQNADDRARFCREFPEKCASSATSSGVINPQRPADPAARCAQYAQYGCSWNGTICSCPGKVPYCQLPSGGCGSGNAWDFSICSCRSYQDYCQSKPGCSWTGVACQCTTTDGKVGTYTPAPTPSATPGTNSGASVKGVSITESLLQKIFHFLGSR